MPYRDGVIDAFRQAAPYPCSLRYEDLTRIVYLKKAEQYDALAVLMGFTPQVEYQKVLRRVTRKLEEETKKQQAVVDREKSKLAKTVGESPDAAKLLTFLQRQYVSANVAVPATAAEAAKALEGLKEAIRNDPRATSLADHTSLRKWIAGFKSGAAVETDLAAYSGAVETFKNAERDAVDLVLLGLYEKGKEVVEKRDLGENAPCPLCGNLFDGSLADHIKRELATLQSLSSEKDKLDASRKRQVTAATPYGKLAKELEAGSKDNPVATDLSESQLNSFGLALFLAAARRFNAGFRFLLLDDIVNSFDAYKRPQLVKLLKTEFGDFQFLLLTHDEVWCEQLFSNFPQWARKRITRYLANHQRRTVLISADACEICMQAFPMND